VRTDDRSGHLLGGDEVPESAIAEHDAIRAIAQAAAEAVALIEHHRAELRGVVTELTALQRDVRTQIHELAAHLDAVAELTGPEDANDSPETTRRRFRRR